jgi:hypothetical protein
MKYEFKSIESHEWDKLFAVMEAEKGVNPFAKKDDKKDDKKEDKKEDKEDKGGKKESSTKPKFDPKADAKKLAELEQKNLDEVFKKLVDNFKKFQISASGKGQNWVNFVNNNLKFKGTEGGSKINVSDLKSPYKLWDADYAVGCRPTPEGGSSFVVKQLRKDGVTEDVLVSASKDACKKYAEFYKLILATVKKFKQEEKMRREQEKLGGFLKA